ncbi:unnamed protein product [Oikopleura dioica]|uniref:Fibronectin type-III domain-containing protein n=1 Tax=Oikopleura dioica TaxID=34765 RepID=E4XBZ4_OIKDI|nr:unnamed protein product [Oikopleura dioica]
MKQITHRFHDDDSSFKTAFEGQETNYSFRELKKAAKYRFRIAGLTKDGQSDFSKTCDESTGQDPPTQPSRPIRTRLEKNANFSEEKSRARPLYNVTLEWKAPKETGGSSIVEFKVQQRNADCIPIPCNQNSSQVENKPVGIKFLNRAADEFVAIIFLKILGKKEQQCKNIEEAALEKVALLTSHIALENTINAEQISKLQKDHEKSVAALNSRIVEQSTNLSEFSDALKKSKQVQNELKSEIEERKSIIANFPKRLEKIASENKKKISEEVERRLKPFVEAKNLAESMKFENEEISSGLKKNRLLL